MRLRRSQCRFGSPTGFDFGFQPGRQNFLGSDTDSHRDISLGKEESWSGSVRSTYGPFSEHSIHSDIGAHGPYSDPYGSEYTMASSPSHGSSIGAIGSPGGSAINVNLDFYRQIRSGVFGRRRPTGDSSSESSSPYSGSNTSGSDLNRRSPGFHSDDSLGIARLWDDSSSPSRERPGRRSASGGRPSRQTPILQESYTFPYDISKDDPNARNTSVPSWGPSPAHSPGRQSIHSDQSPQRQMAESLRQLEEYVNQGRDRSGGSRRRSRSQSPQSQSEQEFERQGPNSPD